MGTLIFGGIKHENTIWFSLTGTGTLEINENSADVARKIFAYYLAGASLGRVADMLYAQQKFANM